MGLTGLFLVTFLVVHLSGNLQLFMSDNGVAFNTYTKFMTTNPLIRVAEWILFAGFIVHIIYAIILTRQNRKARPVRYAYSNPKGSSTWFSRNMGVTGSIVFIFLAVHLYMFWGIFHWGGGEMTPVNDVQKYVYKVTDDVTAGGNTLVSAGDYLDEKMVATLQSQNVAQVKAISMYDISKKSFGNPLISLFYVIAMVLLGFHLNHGFQSAFRTLGFVHEKYTPFLTKLGTAISVLFPLVFAAMPIYLYLTQ